MSHLIDTCSPPLGRRSTVGTGAGGSHVRPTLLGQHGPTILVFGRARRLQTADINSRPPFGLTRFRHNRIDSGSALARYNSHCISRNCPFKESTVRSKSTSRSTSTDLLAVSIISLLSFHNTVQ